jgi:hypothetical protein
LAVSVKKAKCVCKTVVVNIVRRRIFVEMNVVKKGKYVITTVAVKQGMFVENTAVLKGKNA